MELVSTMGTGSLGRELDLDPLISDLELQHGEVVNANFRGDAMVTIRLEEGGPAYTLYRTGSFQIRGAKTEEKLVRAEKRFREALDELDIEVDDYEFEHVTSVFMETLDQKVDLETAMIALGLENAEYEPEQFPGLIYRPPSFDVSLLVFASGKIIIGGTTDRDQALDAIDHLREQLSTIERV
ncbi:transcription factor [Haloferax volcanii]|uniref:Transcription factor n=1 Tax=Haloferax volcanii TaxID=2246 RepID=A0A558GDL3_HALVO|nr:MULTISPECIES: transcription factor [Haloferax]QIB79557.1 transcription factor [Haloferax alexandrinus]TVT95834.1 transcription factor [Haloferax volcanii]